MNAPDAPIAEEKTAEEAFERRVAAVSQAVDDHHTYLLNYLHGLTRQMQDAENLLQDLWRHVLIHFEEDKIGVLPLLRRKAYQLFVDHYRKIVRRGETLSDEVPEMPDPTRDFSSATDEEELALKRKFWDEYPIEITDEQKEVLWLNARYGFTYKEIEDRLGVASSTVGDWITLGRKKLADYINSESQL